MSDVPQPLSAIPVEDTELIQLVWDKVKEASYLRRDTLYVGPKMYERIIKEPYFNQFKYPDKNTIITPWGAKIVVVYENAIVV